jgi:hypothetical protein
MEKLISADKIILPKTAILNFIQKQEVYPNFIKIYSSDSSFRYSFAPLFERISLFPGYRDLINLEFLPLFFINMPGWLSLMFLFSICSSENKRVSYFYAAFNLITKIYFGYTGMWYFLFVITSALAYIYDIQDIADYLQGRRPGKLKFFSGKLNQTRNSEIKNGLMGNKVLLIYLFFLSQDQTFEYVANLLYILLLTLLSIQVPAFLYNKITFYIYTKHKETGKILLAIIVMSSLFVLLSFYVMYALSPCILAYLLKLLLYLTEHSHKPKAHIYYLMPILCNTIILHILSTNISWVTEVSITLLFSLNFLHKTFGLPRLLSTNSFVKPKFN